MAILRSSDGKFYDVADDHLHDKMIPAEKIKQKLGEMGSGPAPSSVSPAPPMTVPGTGGQVVIQIYTSGNEANGCEPTTEEPGEIADVEAHGWCWRRNYFSNCWRRNCWRNCRPW